MSVFRNLRRIPLVLCALVVFTPAPAFAHARLLRSLPASGAHVASASVIRLWFSERTEARLTSVVLRDQNGATFSVATPQAVANDQTQVVASIVGELSPGHYTVDWRTMATDGHPSHGQFSFTVVGEPAATTQGNAQRAVVAPSATATTTSRATAVSDEGESSASPANSLARAVSFAGILLVIGIVVFNLLVLARCDRIGSELVWRMESRAATVGVGAGILVVAAAFARISLESRMMSSMPGMESMGVTTMVLHSLWGFGMQLQIVAGALAAIAFSIAIPRVRFAWMLATLAAVGLAFAPALAGHAAASIRFQGMMIFTDFLHVAGAASWLGNLACVMLIGVPIIIATAAGDDRWQRVSALVNTFSPIALASATVVLLSGVIAAVVHLESMSALWSTAYGQLLLAKIAVVLVTLAIGAYNFRRVQPELVREQGTARLRRSTTFELATASLIVLITGFLTGVSP